IVLAMRLSVARLISYCGFFHARLIVLNGTFASLFIRPHRDMYPLQAAIRRENSNYSEAPRRRGKTCISRFISRGLSRPISLFDQGEERLQTYSRRMVATRALA